MDQTKQPKTAPGFLKKARAIMTERGKTYDSPEGERSMNQTVQAYNAITGQQMSEPDGWLFMLLLKNVRQYQTPTFHRDSAEDAVSYSALLAESLATEKTS